MSGTDVKAIIKQNGLKCWEVAEKWGLSDGNFSRKLRKPFSEEDVEKLKNIISELICQKNGGNSVESEI